MNRCPLHAPACSPLATLLLVLAASCSLVGCAPFATYPPDGSGPNVYPWMPPCPEVMATSLRQAHDRVAPDSPLIFNIPAGASRRAWDDVQERLGPDARRMTEGDVVVWDVERFGIRNTRAFADILYWNDGTSILLTVSLERENILPFRFSHMQRFYVSSKAMPKDNYPSPAISTELDVETTEVVDTTGDSGE